MSKYTPQELLEQDKYPLFPFYMANYADEDSEKFEREWQAGCAKLSELVKSGRIEKSDASHLIDNSYIVIDKTNLPNERKEVLKKMTMLDIAGVGVDWVEVKRQKDEAVAVARIKTEAEAEAKAHKKAVATAKEALEMGLTPNQAAKISGLSIDEVEALIG